MIAGLLLAFAFMSPVAFSEPAAAAERAQALRYPYVAAFSRRADKDRIYFCTGALVAPRWILTAAHCFHARNGQVIATGDLWAALGRGRLREAQEDAQIRVDRLVIHSDYDPTTQANDIALVRLQEIAGPLIADAAMSPPLESRATMLGFGNYFEGRLAGNALNARGRPTSQLSDELRRASGWLIDGDPCLSGDGLLCLIASPDDACTGDSGGPLVEEAADGPDRLIGILSGGSGCAVPAPVAIYTDVSAYSNWIAATLALD